MGSIAIPSGGGNSKMIDLGTGTSFDVSSYQGYKNFTVDNFVILDVPSVTSGNNNVTSRNQYDAPVPTEFNATITGVSKSYNASTGVFTCSLGYGSNVNYYVKKSSTQAERVYTTPRFSTSLRIGLIY